MEKLCAAAETLVPRIAAAHSLLAHYDYHEIFVASVNEPTVVEHLRRALDEEGVAHGEESLPMRASEDFGIFGHSTESAMFFLGAGERPALHNPDYDFPDDLIPIGSAVFMRTARNLLGG
jgi:metal-dependent amidase/aminoacylase/carboxypeptidase family protein